MRHTKLTSIVVCTLVLTTFLGVPAAHGANIWVNANGDLPDTDVLDGVCETITGSCSLRAAIMHANWTWGHDYIHFNYGWTHNVNSPLEISSLITIYGEGSDGTGTNIDGGGSYEVFQIQSPPTPANPSELTIEDVQIRDGRRNITVQPDAELVLRGCEIRDGQANLGGGIYAEDALVWVENSLIWSNTATNGGGGIYFDSPDPAKYLYLYQTDIKNNITGSNGAGIHAVSNGSTVTLNRVRLENNQTITGWGGGVFAQLTHVFMQDSTLTGNLALKGGGIYAMMQSVEILQSSIWGNFGGHGGGGIYLTLTQTGTSEIINTTISGNSTSGNGGGIYLDSSGENWYGLELSNCTITGNTADLNTDDVGDGGGIYREGAYDVLIMQNTILAGNHDLSSSGYIPDCVARVNSRGYNIIGVATPSCNLVGDQTGNQTGTVASPLDPLLGTRTDEPHNAYHPVLEASPAVDNGNPAGCTRWGNSTLLTNDQILGVRPISMACDPGSIESPWITLPTLEVSLAGHGDGTVTSMPAGISCPGDCSEEYDPGTWVTLTATPDNTYYQWFWGWQGDADCSDGAVTMDSDVSCTALFEEYTTHLFTLQELGSGDGSVTLHMDGFDIPCTGSCGVNLVDGEEITMLPTAEPGSTFVGFGGDPDCLDGFVTLTSDTTCTATFDLAGGDTIFSDGFESGDTSGWSTTTP